MHPIPKPSSLFCRSKPTVPIRSFANQAKKKVVILGTGWAGFRILKDINQKEYDVTVVSPRNYFLFTPLLTSTTVGTLEFRGVIEPLRTSISTPFTYLQGECLSVDVQQNCITAKSVYEHKEVDGQKPYYPQWNIPYDYLVVAVGAASNTFNIPGVEKYCFFLRQVSDARAIRQRIIECFERATSPDEPEAEKNRLLHFVIVGGGPTSVEFAAELHDFLKQDVHKVYPELEDKVQITLIEAGKTLLSTFDANLSEYTLRLFQKRKIDVRTGVSVKEVKRHEIILSDGTTIPFGLGVWSTGVTATSFVKSLPFEKERSGRLLIDDHMRVKISATEFATNIFAAGDCASFEDRPLPQTAQVAEQEGKYIAKLLNAHVNQVEPFKFQNRGMLAYVGGKRSVVDTPLVKNSGFLSWLFWNAAYITKLVSIKNKIMIPMYWFKSFVFGRDIARF